MGSLNSGGGIVISSATPTTQAHGDSAVVGTDGDAADAAHKHAMPAAGGSAIQAKGVEYSRTAAAGAGDQALTGAGFTPTGCIVWAADSGTDDASWGFGDSDVGENHMRAVNAVLDPGQGTLINIQDGTNVLSAVLKTLDSDGGTLTWSKTAAGLDVVFEVLWLR